MANITSTHKRVILFLDDDPDRHQQMDRRFIDDIIIHCWTVDDVIDCLNSPIKCDIVSLDHDLNDFDSKSVLYDGQEATGMDVCGFLVGRGFQDKLPDVIDIHSTNHNGAQRMRDFLQARGFTVRWIPFKCDDDQDDD
jgi:hypothetical protein